MGFIPLKLIDVYARDPSPLSDQEGCRDLTSPWGMGFDYLNVFDLFFDFL